MPKHSWQQSFAAYIRPQVLGMSFLGFSAGLPFLK
jgi:PAT family beta-lactamase induction signal transducer AmpG